MEVTGSRGACEAAENESATICRCSGSLPIPVLETGSYPVTVNSVLRMSTLFRWTLLVVAASYLAASDGNQILLRNLDPADGFVPQAITADRSGNLFVLSTLLSGNSRIVKLDLTGARLASMDIQQQLKGTPQAARTSAGPSYRDVCRPSSQSSGVANPS